METLGAYLGLGAIAGIIATCWAYIKGFWRWLSGLIIVRCEVDGLLALALGNYLWKNWKQSPLSERSYSCEHVYVRSSRRMQYVPFERIGRTSITFWNGWIPLWLASIEQKQSSTGNYRNPLLNISYLRWSINLEDILIKTAKTYRGIEETPIGKPASRRFTVYKRFGKSRHFTKMGEGAEPYPPPSDPRISREGNETQWGGARFLGVKENDIGWAGDHRDPFQILAYPDSMFESITEIERWRNSEDWYKDRSIPWRRGWLIHGKPGTGKTSLVRAVAQKLDLPVYVFDISGMSNEDLTAAWHEATSDAPAIILLEDIDTTFSGRTNVSGQNTLTFDHFLNTISGIEPSEGILLVITTNKYDTIDDALGKMTDKNISSRPGRIDTIIGMPDILDDACRSKVANVILKDWPELVEPTVADGVNHSGAQFQWMCTQRAAAEYWKCKNRSVFGESLLDYKAIMAKAGSKTNG